MQPSSRQPALDIDRAYREHGHVVLRRARAILGDEHDAREALQEVFVSLLDRPEQFHGNSAITTWLYRATTNLCLNKIRNRKNRSRLLDREVKPRYDGAAAGSAEDAVHASQILRQMPAKLARVAVYYYLDGMTHDEIAHVMGCSRRQVGNLLDRFQVRLRKHERQAA